MSHLFIFDGLCMSFFFTTSKPAQIGNKARTKQCHVIGVSKGSGLQSQNLPNDRSRPKTPPQVDFTFFLNGCRGSAAGGVLAAEANLIWRLTYILSFSVTTWSGLD